ncbi:polyamine aminopropyltransferase [Tamlana sp. I1]|uniref:polyamine aminopropyltransferase n=1 Tax=Tamlana sp. I1 TaxID=2762061 RepID=UPI00188FCDFF|nr:polyamine aminopropyltransferase [Tamlana sp. I1]
MHSSVIKQKILFLALFATGLSGIVAEYSFATLSTYFVGDSVKQWSIVISLMLFSMGLGSRITKSFDGNIFKLFIITEFILSFIVSFSAVTTYYLASQIDYIGIYIYSMAIVTGTLIGMELPLAMRLNDEFQSLKLNVANILEKDYYGSLIGGLFFVFIGLPYLGLTYTPFILGFINLSVAIVLLIFFKNKLNSREQIYFYFFMTVLSLSLILGCLFSQKVILHGEQTKYKDKIIFQEQSIYQKIIVTKWKDNYWLYLNDNLQFSTFDEPLYHEVLVHPVMQILQKPRNILILGGGDGCAARELLKYNNVQKITLVDLDKKLTDLFIQEEELTEINKQSLTNPKVNIINKDGFTFISDTDKFYDLIIIDLPDPRNIELSRLYSKEFYELCRIRLTQNGGLITQAGSPYYTPNAFECINKTLKSAGFSSLKLHNQVLSMGEWGWVLGTKKNLSHSEMTKLLSKFNEDKIETKWLNNESMELITKFGKDFYNKNQTDSIMINQISNPVLYHYYNEGNWDTY